VPETTEAYEDLRGTNPGALEGMLESGTPGELVGYGFDISDVFSLGWMFQDAERPVEGVKIAL
jgi:hypothetical protein